MLSARMIVAVNIVQNIVLSARKIVAVKIV